MVGPLQGLPVSIKDLFAAAGYPCFAGSSRRLPADPWADCGADRRNTSNRPDATAPFGENERRRLVTSARIFKAQTKPERSQ
jgi:hypothetical protein